MASYTLDRLLKSKKLGIGLFWKPMVDYGRNSSLPPGKSYCFFEQNQLTWLLTCWFLVFSRRTFLPFGSAYESFPFGVFSNLESKENIAGSINEDYLLLMFDMKPQVMMFFFSLFRPLEGSSIIQADSFFFSCLIYPGIIEYVVESSSIRSTIALQFLERRVFWQSLVQLENMPFIARGDRLNIQAGQFFSHSSQTPSHYPSHSKLMKSIKAPASSICPIQFLTKQAIKFKKKFKISIFLCKWSEFDLRC